MKIIFTILLASLLVGCATGSPQQLRNELGADRRYSFELDTGYQQVYRRLVDVMRCRYNGNMITASMLVNSDLYTDTRTGTISVGMYGGLGTVIYQVIDLRALDNGGTEVVAIFPSGSVQKMGEQVKAWATGSDNQC
jgi:hypothetical protein